ncbi:hypothetical protein E2562_032624 [Oryza meyeriana var. granulata]|uniref:Uncharacterized protein n=1 Tax=Oryza meyeriana var. granulata TaxID=110450 RepID=A0A6G1D9Y8_9ORYZ|nr:hypothetical protein E2562_032624 [Oryza meyeriana var. granulata]
MVASWGVVLNLVPDFMGRWGEWGRKVEAAAATRSERLDASTGGRGCGNGVESDGGGGWLPFGLLSQRLKEGLTGGPRPHLSARGGRTRARLATGPQSGWRKGGRPTACGPGRKEGSGWRAGPP